VEAFTSLNTFPSGKLFNLWIISLAALFVKVKARIEPGDTP